MNVSVIIPIYNSEKSLAILVERLIQTLEQSTKQYEIIGVNDCSPDNSAAILDNLAAEHTNVQPIHLSRNFGQHNALLCGIMQAQYNTIITIDDDLQHPPEQIPVLLNKLVEGYDVVYGIPEKQQHGLWRDLASRITKLTLQNAMGSDVASKISAFRAFKTNLREAFRHYSGSFVSIDVLLTWATTNFTVTVVEHAPRPYDQSNYTVFKLIVHALNLVTGFSVLPLQIASLMGFIFTLFGFGILIVTLWVRFTTADLVPGFYFLASIISIFAGVQLFCLGIIGEYLARMHFKTQGRPSYVMKARNDDPNN